MSDKTDAALGHACIAIDATSRKLRGLAKSQKSAYKACLRQYMWIIEPMIGVGLNLVDTRFENLKLSDGKAIIESPDLADVVYHIFRCSYAHGDEVPLKYTLTASEPGHYRWHLSKDALQMPATIVWALLAVSVFARVNADLSGGGSLYLSWGSSVADQHHFPLAEWWGREDDFRAFIEPRNCPRVKLDKLGGQWGID